MSHPGQSGAGCEKPTKRYLHETRNTCFIFDICSFLNSLCLLGLKLFSVPLHLIPRDGADVKKPARRAGWIGVAARLGTNAGGLDF